MTSKTDYVDDRADGCPCGRECLACSMGNHVACVRRRDRCSVNEGLPMTISVDRCEPDPTTEAVLLGMFGRIGPRGARS